MFFHSIVDIPSRSSSRILSSTDDVISSIGQKSGNRALEANIKPTAKGGEEEEEFCLRDKESGEIILLTKVIRLLLLCSSDEATDSLNCLQEEKERIFLDTIQSYYFSGRTALSDKQFDRLREDLSWEARSPSLSLSVSVPDSLLSLGSVGICLGDIEPQRDPLSQCDAGLVSLVSLSIDPDADIPLSLLYLSYFRPTPKEAPSSAMSSSTS